MAGFDELGGAATGAHHTRMPEPFIEPLQAVTLSGPLFVALL